VNNRIPVLIWAYHVDLWPEILSLLLPVKDLIDVRVGLYEHNTDNFIVEDSIKIFDKYHISYHPNCGGDVLPFLLQLDSLDFNKSDVFLKIHTKKSLFGRKIEWRKILYYNLIGTRSIFLKNINKMTSIQTGALTCGNLIMKNLENTNSEIIEKISEDILQIPYSHIKNKKFCGGNMFFGQTSTFKSFFNTDSIPKLEKQLRKETGKISDVKQGTYAHSLERLFGYIVGYNGQKILRTIVPTKRILNSLAPQNRLHIITMYDGSSCYLEEDINVVGNVILNSKEKLKVEWYHLDNPVTRTYKYISDNTLINAEANANK